MAKVKDIIILPGFFTWFFKGQKKVGLHLNKFVRDVMRECGYDCYHCSEQNCYDEDCKHPRNSVQLELQLLKDRITALEQYHP